MSNELDILLRYYTQLSLTHASIVVASIFGLFSVLRIISDRGRSSASKNTLTIVYVILLAFGAYETARYKFYADLAGRIAIENFGAVEWWSEWKSIKPLVDMFFNYIWLWYVLLGLIALVGGYDDLHKLICIPIVRLKEKLRK